MEKFTFTRKEKVYLLLAFFVLLTLFISSSMTYHQQKMSPGFINQKFGLLENIVGNWSIYYGGRWHNAALDGGQAGMTQFVLRKLAHFSSYFCLGLFGFLGIRRIFKINALAPIISWMMVLAFAALDEYHQYLTGDRTPSIHDVMLDGLGGLCAIVIAILIIWLIKKFTKKQA